MSVAASGRRVMRAIARYAALRARQARPSLDVLDVPRLARPAVEALADVVARLLELGRYAAPVGYYQAALELDPNGRLANEAIYGYLYGTFYDGFRDDPLQPLTRDAALLRTQLDLGERFVREFPRDRNLEEVKFITAVLYVRAARAGGTDASRSAARARELLRQFERDYPDSMRTAAVPVLLDALR